MGCDIHFFVELKTGADPHGWEAEGAEGAFYEGRSYLLFAHLAGVRNDDPNLKPIVEPRGLPEDMSSFVRDYMGDEVCGKWDFAPDYHSHSYLTLTELLAYNWPDDLQHFNDTTIHQLVMLSAQPGMTTDDIRIVFAFDN